MSGWIQIGEDRWILDVMHLSPGLLGLAEIRQDKDGRYRILGDAAVSVISKLRDIDLAHAKEVAETFVREKLQAAVNVARALHNPPKKRHPGTAAWCRTPERSAALKIQGSYIGLLRNLPPDEQVRMKTLAKQKGMAAAIEVMKHSTEERSVQPGGEGL